MSDGAHSAEYGLRPIPPYVNYVNYHTKKVAEMLNISYGTIRCHQKNIYKKLHVNSLVEAVTVFREL